MAYTVGQRLYKEEGEHAGGSGPVQVLLADMGQEAGAARFGSVAEEMTGGGAPVDRDKPPIQRAAPDSRRGSWVWVSRPYARPSADRHSFTPGTQGPLPRLPCRTD